MWTISSTKCKRVQNRIIIKNPNLLVYITMSLKLSIF
jgi:hypothetical protein